MSRYSNCARGTIGRPVEERFRLDASVRFGDPDHDFASVLLRLPRGLEHGEGFPDARAHAEEDLQLAAGSGAFLALDLRKKGIRIRPLGLTHAERLSFFVTDSSMPGTLHVQR